MKEGIRPKALQLDLCNSQFPFHHVINELMHLIWVLHECAEGVFHTQQVMDLLEYALGNFNGYELLRAVYLRRCLHEGGPIVFGIAIRVRSNHVIFPPFDILDHACLNRI